MSSIATSHASEESELPVVPGQILEGKFRVERIVGEGSMGLVIEATHLDLDERVALKFLRREARERPDIVARFAREARAAAKIKSDHVARVFDVGGTKDGLPFIVMEFLEGMDLETAVMKTGPLGAPEAALAVIQTCEGLTAAHALGIVHRDIKPANLFRVEHAGAHDVKVLDFGISKAAIRGTFDDIDVASSDTTQIMGSPHYMSPEQIRSTKDVDARADLWSLGVVLFELLTGATPFTATEVTGIIAQVLHDRPLSARSLVPSVPVELEAIIERCLQKDPEQRYQTAADLAVALAPFAPKRARAIVERAVAMSARASGQLVASDSLPPPPSSSPALASAKTELAPALAATSPSLMTGAEPARRPFVWIALGCIVLGLTGAIIALLFRQTPRPDPTTVAQPTASTASLSTPIATIAMTTATAAAPATEPTPSAVVASPDSTTGAGASAATPPSGAPRATPTPAAPIVSAKNTRPAHTATPRTIAKPPSSPVPPVDTDIRRER